MSKFFNYKNPHEVAALISFLLILALAIFFFSIPGFPGPGGSGSYEKSYK
jgi:hypothetical protein